MKVNNQHLYALTSNIDSRLQIWLVFSLLVWITRVLQLFRNTMAGSRYHLARFSTTLETVYNRAHSAIVCAKIHKILPWALIYCPVQLQLSKFSKRDSYKINTFLQIKYRSYIFLLQVLVTIFIKNFHVFIL